MIRPLLDYVLIKADEKEKMTAGGIALPERDFNDGERASDWETGTIVAVGEGKITDDNIVIPTRLQANRRCVFRAFSGQRFPDGPYKGHVLVPFTHVGGYID